MIEANDEKIVAITGKLDPCGTRNLEIDRAIFKAGIRKVVEWIEEHEEEDCVEEGYLRLIGRSELQAQKKEWGIK